MVSDGTIRLIPLIKDLIDAGSLFVINTSGGKDSQAMTIHLRKVIPIDQLVLVHSHLPEVEWPGVKEHIQNTNIGIDTNFVQGTKTFFQMVDHRQRFPSSKNRQCTSDLKRDPIQKFINGYCKEKGFKTVVNCLGLRAEESPGRAKKSVLKINTRYDCAHRTQYEWLPIHHFAINEVWNTISNAGQLPHWAYSKGMTRLSCCFCIMASKQDIKTAAGLMPELFKKYTDKEEELGFTLIMPVKGITKTLKEIVND